MLGASQVLLCCAVLAVLAVLAGPAEARRLRRGLLPPARPRPLVLALRRPGLRSYEKVIEEFRGRVSAEVRVLAARPRAAKPAVAELKRWVEHVRPNLVFAVGQSAHDFARSVAGGRSMPLLHVLVYHRPAASAANTAGIASQPPPLPVMQAFALARPPTARGGRVLVVHGPDTAKVAAAARPAAAEHGLRLEELVAASPADALRLLRRAVAATPKRQAERLVGIWLVADPKVLTLQVCQYAIVVQFRRRVALMGATRQHVSLGALFAVDLDPAALGRQAARVANSMLHRRERRRRRRGEPTLTTLLERTEARLSVNQVTARRLGVLLERLAPLAPEVLR